MPQDKEHSRSHRAQQAADSLKKAYQESGPHDYGPDCKDPILAYAQYRIRDLEFQVEALSKPSPVGLGNIIILHRDISLRTPIPLNWTIRDPRNRDEFTSMKHDPENPYHWTGLSGKDWTIALIAFRDSRPETEQYVYWYAPINGGARRITSTNELIWGDLKYYEHKQAKGDTP